VTAREIIDAGRYMVLATADEHGVPWASPAWYALDSKGAPDRRTPSL
jgi:predicted pyridoxine 5'-phosphate oxidase superfamily flavin-nucleotide-binding protein